MNIEKNDTYTVLKPEKDTVFSATFEKIKETINTHSDANIILDFSDIIITVTHINQFKDISEEKQESGTSFVILSTVIDMDLISEEIIIVPSFQEAIDMIEMDEMTRSLDI